MKNASREHARVELAVDLVILTVRDTALQVLLVERGKPPYRGRLALPGGFVRPGEDLPEAALRELAEETGIAGTDLHLEQLGTYGAPQRDPRGHIVSVAYLAIAPGLPTPVAGSDAAAARWWPVAGLGPLAFDHTQILTDGVERARAKLEYTNLATVFCGETFTIGELRHVYEVVWGYPLDPGNFSRKVTRTEGFAIPTGAKRVVSAGRPPELYRAGGAKVLYPPMLRVEPGQRAVAAAVP
ncbi:MAG TPA: NUDIX domain-containing protein [Rugosimonospora sp.]|nr:NUDIX domain-containing protein [Rugosimonospora sp.]